MPTNWRNAKWKGGSDYCPRTGGAAPESVTVGMRIVYIGDKASHLPVTGKGSLELNAGQYRSVMEDILRLERTSLGGAVPRKSDVQLCPFMAGTVDVVWPGMSMKSLTFKRVLAGLKLLQRVPQRELAYLAISCIIMYFLPPALISLDRQQPWDAPCAIVSDPRAVDKSLEALCSAALVRQPLLEDDDREMKGTPVERQRLPSPSRSMASSSTRGTTPWRPVSPGRARSRSPSPARRRSRSPPRGGQDRPYRRDRKRKYSFSPPPTHFAPGQLPPAALAPRARDLKDRSPARASSPPRKRIRAESPRADSVNVRLGIDARDLERQVQRLERENEEASERESALRSELHAEQKRNNAKRLLQEDINVWKGKAAEAEERVRSQCQRLHDCVPDGRPDVAVGTDDFEGALERVWQTMSDLQRRASAAKRDVQVSRARTARDEGALTQNLDAPAPAQSIFDACRMVSNMAQELLG